MINVNDLRAGVVFEMEKQLLQVLTYEHIKMGRGSGNIKVKVRNLKTGSIVEKSFITGARVQDVDLDRRSLQYLYHDEAFYHFMDPENYEQFAIERAILAHEGSYLKEGMTVQVLFHQDEPLSVLIPNSMEYAVLETGPSERGNSVSNIYKPATLENNLVVSVPLFIKTGDVVKVDTRGGTYMERAGK